MKKLRTVTASQITETVKDLFLDANRNIGKDVTEKMLQYQATEASPVGRTVLEQLLENQRIAANDKVPLCQDTGMAVVFVDIGQDVHITEGDYESAINEGVCQAYQQGYFRNSVVGEPLFHRTNTNDNTPAVIHTRIVPGDKVHILVTPKGFGSENMSALKMLVPADGIEGVKRFVLETVKKAGPNPCPPIILGIGIGGTFEKAALMAKRCTTRPLDQDHPDPRYAELEKELLQKINALGIGPAGIGGNTTALKVSIDYAATHIAGLPVAVNICCLAARHAERTI